MKIFGLRQRVLINYRGPIRPTINQSILSGFRDRKKCIQIIVTVFYTILLVIYFTFPLFCYELYLVSCSVEEEGIRSSLNDTLIGWWQHW
jgi:hypothetical protein